MFYNYLEFIIYNQFLYISLFVYSYLNKATLDILNILLYLIYYIQFHFNDIINILINNSKIFIKILLLTNAYIYIYIYIYYKTFFN